LNFIDAKWLRGIVVNEEIEVQTLLFAAKFDERLVGVDGESHAGRRGLGECGESCGEEEKRRSGELAEDSRRATTLVAPSNQA